MFRECLPGRQLSAWIFAAVTPVAIQLTAGTSWLWTGIVSVVCALAVRLVWTKGAVTLPKWFAVLGFIVVALTAGELVSAAGYSWPTGNRMAVPMILLALAAWSAQKGPSAAARVGCVLFWAVVAIYFIVLAAGAKEVQMQWLRPVGSALDWDLVIVSLAPAAACVLLEKERRWSPRLMLPGAFILCASIITAGVLSPAVESKLEDAFYEMSRSLSVLGVAKRFEAVVSAGMTLGWFALLNLYFTVCGKYFERICCGWGRIGVFMGAAIAGVWLLCNLHIPKEALAIMAAVFGVVLPLLAQGIERIKKS